MSKTAPLVFAFVLGLAFVLLMATFRSVVIALKAIVLNLLSVGAAYGVLVWVFQDGHLESPLGFESSGGITAWLPLFLFVLLFGLSMDYHVFIVSRIREAYDGGMSTGDAVAHGIKSTAGVVTSAAVVMIAVFSIFATLGALDFKQMGVGLAVGDPDRRDDRPRGPVAGDDEAARRVELVPAELARLAASRRARAGARAGRRLDTRTADDAVPPRCGTASSALSGVMTYVSVRSRGLRRALGLGLLTTLAVADLAQARPGDLDPTFGDGGFVITDFGADEIFGDIAIHADDKIAAAGFSADDFAVAQYTADGALDPTFSGDGLVITGFGAAEGATSVAVQPDGKVVAAGYTQAGPNPPNFALARYNTDGSLDLSFDGDGLLFTDFGDSDTATDVDVQADGRIVATGATIAGAGMANFAFARYNPTDRPITRSTPTACGRSSSAASTYPARARSDPTTASSRPVFRPRTASSTSRWPG